GASANTRHLLNDHFFRLTPAIEEGRVCSPPMKRWERDKVRNLRGQNLLGMSVPEMSWLGMGWLGTGVLAGGTIVLFSCAPPAPPGEPVNQSESVHEDEPEPEPESPVSQEVEQE